MIGIIGLAVFIAIAFGLSNDRKKINWKTVVITFVLQLLLAFVSLHTPLWKGIQATANGVSWVIGQSQAGIEFVFGGIANEGAFVFFLNALLPIIFISALMGILFHFGIIQRIIQVFGMIVARFLNVDAIVAVNAVTNMFLGQTEALTVTQAYLPSATPNVIFATVVGGMTSISVSVTGLYTSFGARMEYILLSMLLTVFSTLILTQIVRPTRYISADNLEIQSDRGANVLDTMMAYANMGFKIVIGVTVALITFISITTLLNGLLGIVIPGLTIERILSFFFFPFAFVMGIPSADVSQVSELLAIKFFVNEAVAYGTFSEMLGTLSEKTQVMVTFALSGFAAISSIGIMIGGYAAIAPQHKEYVARIGALALVVAYMANLFTATVIGLFL